MSRLLSAGLIRLKKSKLFWLFCGLMFALGLFFPASLYLQAQKYNLATTIDQTFFSHVMYMGVISAVFVSLFIGTEYSDGAIRNKLMLGHSRISIYFSNLILCMTATLFISVSYMIPNAAAGILLLGSFALDPKTVIILVFCLLCISFTITALFTMAAMLIHNKASIAVATILAAFLLLFAASYLAASLSQPKELPNYMLTADGEVKQGEPVPNRRYLSGTKRQAYQFLLEFLPQGQSLLLTSGELPVKNALVYDGIIAVFATGLGVLGFRKKDIK